MHRASWGYRSEVMQPIPDSTHPIIRDETVECLPGFRYKYIWQYADNLTGATVVLQTIGNNITALIVITDVKPKTLATLSGNP